METTNTNLDITNVLNSLIGTIGAVEMSRHNTPLVAQTAANPAPYVNRATNDKLPYIIAGGAVLAVALFAVLK